jgi:hypothetical protein
MKKNTISLLAILAAFSMTATSTSAQITIPKDSIQKSIAVVEEVEDDTKGQEEFLDLAVKNENVEMPQPEHQNITIDYLAPLGGGVLLLSCLGGAYLLGKKRKEND